MAPAIWTSELRHGYQSPLRPLGWSRRAERPFLVGRGSLFCSPCFLHCSGSRREFASAQLLGSLDG